LEPLYLEANELLAWSEAFAPTVKNADVETIAGICRALDGNARTDNVFTALAIAQWRRGMWPRRAHSPSGFLRRF